MRGILISNSAAMLAAVAECGLTVSVTGPRPVKRACGTDALFARVGSAREFMLLALADLRA